MYVVYHVLHKWHASILGSTLLVFSAAKWLAYAKSHAAVCLATFLRNFLPPHADMLSRDDSFRGYLVARALVGPASLDSASVRPWTGSIGVFRQHQTGVVSRRHGRARLGKGTLTAREICRVSYAFACRKGRHALDRA